MAFRTLTVPMLAGGALALGYAMMALRSHVKLRSAPQKRELEPGPRPEELDAQPEADDIPRRSGIIMGGDPILEFGVSDDSSSELDWREEALSESLDRSSNGGDGSIRPSRVDALNYADLGDIEIDFEDLEREADDYPTMAPEDLGAHWLARATEALSPFHGQPHHDLSEVLEGSDGLVSEASIAAATRARAVTEPDVEDDELIIFPDEDEETVEPTRFRSTMS